MGRDRQFVDGEGRSESLRHTGVLVCKQNVRKRKQNKKQKAVFFLSAVKGEFTGWGRGTCLSSPGESFQGDSLTHICAHHFVLTEEQSYVGIFFLKHLE